VTREDRYPYGAVRDAVVEWIGNFPDGKDFHYRDIAEDLDVQAPTVSATIMKMVRSNPPALVHGSKRGMYRKVTKTPEPAAAPAAPVHAERKAPVQLTEYVDAGRPRKPDRNKRPGELILMEVVGALKDGTLMLRADDGVLWKASEL
jgi:hypothetical protein